MKTIILLFGGLVALLGVWGVLEPKSLMRVIGILKTPGGFAAAVLLRLGIGVALILGAPACKFTLALQILGWIAVAAALGLLIFGRKRVAGAIDRFSAKPPPFLRAWSLIAVAFGGFLLYAAI